MPHTVAPITQADVVAFLEQLKRAYKIFNRAVMVRDIGFAIVQLQEAGDPTQAITILQGQKALAEKHSAKATAPEGKAYIDGLIKILQTPRALPPA